MEKYKVAVFRAGEGWQLVSTSGAAVYFHDIASALLAGAWMARRINQQGYKIEFLVHSGVCDLDHIERLDSSAALLSQLWAPSGCADQAAFRGPNSRESD